MWGWWKQFFQREVDLNARVPGAISFKYGELIRSDYATRYGISNIPTDSEWDNLEILTREVLQPTRDKFGPIRITSGFRSYELNKALGGSSNSLHRFGHAADIEPVMSGIKLLSVLEWIHNNCDYRELIAEYFPGGWIHVAYVSSGNDKILKLKDNNHNYTRVSIDYIKELYG